MENNEVARGDTSRKTVYSSSFHLYVTDNSGIHHAENAERLYYMSI